MWRKLCIYITKHRHESSAVKTERGIISTWVIFGFALNFLGAELNTLCNKVGQNKMLLLLLAYAAMLALIGTLCITFFITTIYVP